METSCIQFGFQTQHRDITLCSSDASAFATEERKTIRNVPHAYTCSARRKLSSCASVRASQGSQWYYPTTRSAPLRDWCLRVAFRCKETFTTSRHDDGLYSPRALRRYHMRRCHHSQPTLMPVVNVTVSYYAGAPRSFDTRLMFSSSCGAPVNSFSDAVGP